MRGLAAVLVGLVFAALGWLLTMFPDWSAPVVDQVFAAEGGFSLGILAAWGWQGLVDRDRQVRAAVAEQELTTIADVVGDMRTPDEEVAS